MTRNLPRAPMVEPGAKNWFGFTKPTDFWWFWMLFRQKPSEGVVLVAYQYEEEKNDESFMPDRIKGRTPAHLPVITKAVTGLLSDWRVEFTLLQRWQWKCVSSQCGSFACENEALGAGGGFYNQSTKNMYLLGVWRDTYPTRRDTRPDSRERDEIFRLFKQNAKNVGAFLNKLILYDIKLIF